MRVKVPSAHRPVILRGVTAAASLKLVRPGVVGAVGAHSPRRNRRGLIEAVRPAAIPWDARRYSPRRNRRGLIEALHCRSGIARIATILRGVTAAASLKRAVQAAHRHDAA